MQTDAQRDGFPKWHRQGQFESRTGAVGGIVALSGAII